MASWYDQARQRISEIDAGLPEDCPYDERVKRVRDGYPFGPRERHPYKMWLKAQREYLRTFAPKDAD